MPNLQKEKVHSLRTKIFDLSGQAAKQALLGMVEILKDRPSILLNPFMLIIEDASKLTLRLRENGKADL